MFKRLSQQIAPRPLLCAVILFFCVLAVNLYFRLYPVTFPQLRLQANFNVEQTLAQRSRDLVDKQFPELSEAARSTLVEAAVKDYKKRNAAAVRSQVADEYCKLKDPLQNKFGQTYLFELDCWEWARMVNNVLTRGHHGTTLVNGRPYDESAPAPQGRPSSWMSLLYHASAAAYTVAARLTHVSLHDFLFYLPLVFISLFIAVLFYICARWYGLLAASLSCLFVGLAPVFLPRSCAGWFDTDILNLAFPAGIVYTYLMAYEKEDAVSRIVWVCAAAVATGLFAMTWPWWWFICAVIVAYECFKLLDLLSEHIQYKQDMRACAVTHCFSMGLFLAATLGCVLLMPGKEAFVDFIAQARSTLSLNTPLSSLIWPNVYSTVGELNKPDFLTVVRMTGGFMLFFSSAAAMLFLIARNRGYRGLKRESLFLLVIWFMGSLIVSFKGVRLTMFLLLPMGISLGWGVQELFNAAFAARKKVYFALISAAAGCLVLAMVNNGSGTARNLYPLLDDHWYSVLKTIEEQSPKDVIINSWWDYGDWFKSIAQRRVIFDGQSQNTPQAYWMAKALLAPSETKALRILRMLNNGGNRVFECIDEKLRDPLRSVLLVEKVLELDQQKARVVLSEILDDGQLQEVLRLLYATPGPAFFVVDESMIGKIQPISYIGNWDFIKMYVAKHSRDDKAVVLNALAQYGVDARQAQLLYQDAELLPETAVNGWVSRTLRFYSGLIDSQEKDGRVFFKNGMVFDPGDSSLQCFDAGSGGYKEPKSVFIVDDGGRISRKVPRAPQLPVSVAVLKRAQDYKALVLDEELADSLFTRLFFLEGRGLEHFRLFTRKEAGGRTIRVFEIVWDGQ